jgi:hypothetical protein
MATWVVEVGFTAGASTSTYLYLNDTVRGKLDTNTLAPSDVVTDVTSDVRQWSTKRGADRINPVTRSEAGTATAVLKDANRKYDPTNLSGPYVSAGATQVEPMRVVRFRATWNGTTYNLWHGYADTWQIDYAKIGNYAEVTLSATDAFKVLAALSRAAQSSAVGAGELSGARVTRILNSASWGSGDRVIATGTSTLQGTVLEGDPLSELQLVADTEVGDVYMDATGRLVFRDRTALTTDSRTTTSQATFGDNAGELAYQDVKIEYDEQLLVNQARITRVGGTEQTVNDATSQTKYLVHTYERSDLLMDSDASAKNYAGLVVYQGKNAELRFSEITINPQRDPDNLYPQVLGREIGDRITINLRPDNGDAISRQVIIRGISHEVNRTTWTTKWTLQAATSWTFLILNDASKGLLNTAVLGY